MPDIRTPRFDSRGNVTFAIAICVSHFFIFPARMPAVIVNKACSSKGMLSSLHQASYAIKLDLPLRLEQSEKLHEGKFKNDLTTHSKRLSRTT